MTMEIVTTPNWDDYMLLDSGNGKRLERFGRYILLRPDPDAIWAPQDEKEWEHADAVFNQQGEKGTWVKKHEDMPDSWQMKYKSLAFYAKLFSFKHTGVFPEQAVQWDFIEKCLTRANRQTSFLNLFAYTGIASLVAAKIGAKVTHVDASRPAIGWAKENQATSGLEPTAIRWILDDVLQFVKRELKRRNRYDAILMDPPAYGHGPRGEVWEFHRMFPELLTVCHKLLSDTPIFLMVNAYAISSSPIMLSNMLEDVFGKSDKIESGELTLQEANRQRLLSTGIFARWSA